MSEPDSLERRIGKIFEEKLKLVVPSTDTDLFATGGLDSLSFVELLLELERGYGVKISLEDLEIENFRTIARIARFVTDLLEHRDAQGRNTHLRARGSSPPVGS